MPMSSLVLTIRPVPTLARPRLATSWVVAVFALVLGCVLLVRAEPAVQTPPAQAPRPRLMTSLEQVPLEVTADAQGYIGTEQCMACHEVQARGYDASAHSRIFDARTPAAARGCEACHGPGRQHLENPGKKGTLRIFNKIAPREASQACMTCHSRQEHANWQGGVHDARNVTCVDCHSIHAPKSEKGHLKGTSLVATCAICHRDQASKIQRASHMPVREGKMDCATCHNMHGSTNVSLLRTGNSATEFCVSCHAEKRGPFLWDHAPVRENCVTCHDPHGSSNDRMLVVKAPMLCQRCHNSRRTGHQSAVYDGAALATNNLRIVNRGCVNCHSNIHGSNSPSGQYFQR